MSPKYVPLSFTQCPVCQSEQLEPTSLFVGEGGGDLRLPNRKLKPFMFRNSYGPPLQDMSFLLCGACGLLFKDTDPQALANFIKQFCQD